MTRYRVGVDIGGTFTDIVLLGERASATPRRCRRRSTIMPARSSTGSRELLARSAGGRIVELLHGTTVASNAILEYKGAKTGLITTRGFRDVLEIRNLRMPRLYDMAWTKPPPLVERRSAGRGRRAGQRQGRDRKPLDEESVERAVAKFLVAEGVEAIAVCLLHSYLNPAHEERVKEIVARLAPATTLCISAEVLPVINEYERTSTTVINAYVRPIVERYLDRLIGEVARIGIDAPLLLMQSNGGLTTAKAAAVTPMHIIEFGPAAGVVGVQALMPADRRRERDLVRHGRHHRQGVADRERRGDARRRIPGRRRHRARLAAAVGRRVHAEGAGDRPRRDRRRRRLDPVDRCRRRAAGRAAQRRRLARARSPTTRAAPSRP